MTRSTAARILLPALILLTAAPALAEWRLIFSDEFDEPGLPNPDNWSYEHGFIRNRESQFYTRNRPENARVEDGRLIIEARKERYENPDFDPDAQNQRRRRRRQPQFAEYTSASIHTRGKAEWTHARIEVRAKLPRGRGVWPAIWMLGNDFGQVRWPDCGEIDIMEYVGYEPHTIHANIHTQAYNHVKGTNKGDRIRVERPFDDFHTYTVDWRPDRMDFFVDDRKYFTYEKETGATDAEWPFDKPFYLILNLAIGGSWGGQQGIDDDIFPQQYEIDYVRVYKDSDATADATQPDSP